MDSLLKLGETVGANGKTTLLSYLVTTLMTKMPELLDMGAGLTAVQRASEKVDLFQLRPRVEALRSAVSCGMLEVEQAKDSKLRTFKLELNMSLHKAASKLQQLEQSLGATHRQELEPAAVSGLLVSLAAQMEKQIERVLYIDSLLTYS